MTLSTHTVPASPPTPTETVVERGSVGILKSAGSVLRRGGRWHYATVGLLLGLCAPAGAYLLRVVLGIAEGNSPLDDVSAQSFFYLYSLIGTSLVFSSMGFLAGARVESLQRSQRFYHELSEIDPTTGLLNARAFEKRFSRANDRSRAYGEHLSLLLLDVDHLKTINDRLGHEAGTAALRHIATILMDCKRDADDAARWGGDEFTILMEGADADSAARLAESIVEMTRTTPVRIRGADVEVLVSIGVASGKFAEQRNLFAVADAALYEAKRTGRNQWRLG